jgi:phospholipid/cholesterol/gamma-HCH transport system substrate-binding protein
VKNSYKLRIDWASSRSVGAIFVVVALAIGAIAFQRPHIMTTLTTGDTITATFARDYRLKSYISAVKIAGVPVGTVTTVSESDDRLSVVSMKLWNGATSKLGHTPSAAIRPSTVLGGKYYVELIPGGDPGTFTGNIPLERTRVAVEADAVLETLQPQARKGLQQFLAKTDETLNGGGQLAIQELARDAPATFAASGPVADALTGDRPDDLHDLVSGLNSAARVLNQQYGQVRSILHSFNVAASSVDRERIPLTDTVAQLPDTLRSTRTGMMALRGSLNLLSDTAGNLEPTAEALDPLLHRLRPVLAKARPVVGDLRDVLEDARPLVHDLVPTTTKATHLLGDLDGDVLENINGPIITALNTPWKGEGPYVGNGSPFKLYQDIAYAVANVDGAVKYTDANGATLDIEAGQGIDDISDFKGMPDLEQLAHNLIGPKESPR